MAALAAILPALAIGSTLDQLPLTEKQLSDGTVEVAGSVGSSAFYLQTFNGSGGLLHNRVVSTNCMPQTIALGADGSAVVVGVIGSGALWVNKYSYAGRASWVAPASYRGFGAWPEAPVAAAFDASGDVVVLSLTHSAAGRTNYSTWKLDGLTGVRRWGPVLFDGPGLGDSVPTAMTFDSSGDPIVTGFTFNGADNDGATVIYDGVTGQPLSVLATLAIAGSDDRPTALIAASGALTVTGVSIGGSGSSFCTARYDLTTGVAIWGPILTSPASQQSAPTAIALDEAGNAYVTGYGIEGQDYAFETVKNDASSGEVVWGSVPAGTKGIAVGLVVVSGKAVVTGHVTDSNGNEQFATYAFDDATGELAWGPATFGITGGGDCSPTLIMKLGTAVWVTGHASDGRHVNSVTLRYDAGSGSRL